jgi:hypothetical protein
MLYDEILTPVNEDEEGGETKEENADEEVE